ncbi:MAG: citramalate synthase [Planctomycetaceae bacterium]|nr:citramalate synthase [Planctomycetaceae bacterium]
MRRIEIYDTTLRDGSQGEGVNFSLQDKLLITQRLAATGFDYIEGGYPLSNPKDAEYFQRVRDLPDEVSHKVAAFGMTRRKGCVAEDDVGMVALRDAQTKYCTIVGKTWDLHVLEILRIDEAENLAMIRDSVAFLVAEGRTLFYDAEHFFDGYRANPEFALKTVVAAQDAGAAAIILCDTNGGRLPEDIAAAVDAVRKVLRVPVGIHCHNDCDVAIANSLIAVDRGAVQVQGTINGIGERCGNADLVSVVANLTIKKGYTALNDDGVAHLTELSRYVYEIANMNFRSNQPFVGTSAFAHKGGMHVHAVNRLAASYEHIPPESVGNQRRVLVSELSGRSNIIAKTDKFRLSDDQALMTRILNRVQDLENEGYQFEAAEASFDLLVRKEAGLYRSSFERLHYRVNVETEADQSTTTEATVKLRVNGQIEHVVAEGDGPVNALDEALRKALAAAYPNLSTMQLVDYKVRVINSAEGTAARVRVIIESRDEKDVWSTVGVSENVIEASWLALVDSVEYKLTKDGDAALSNAVPVRSSP